MLLGLLVVDEKLALLSVAVGLVAGDRNGIEDAGCLVEDCVHLLQGPIGSFGVEEVDDGEDKCIAIWNRVSRAQTLFHVEYSHDSKDNICLVFDCVERNRRDHDNHKVEDPVARSCKGVGGSTDS